MAALVESGCCRSRQCAVFSLTKSGEDAEAGLEDGGALALGASSSGSCELFTSISKTVRVII